MKKEKRILIIDDNETTREILCEVLEIEGYPTTDADDGKVGLRLHQEEPFDLIITDIIMPEVEGLETINIIRRISPQVKIIAISGGGRLDAHHYLNLAKKLGADRTFEKPFTKEKIIDAVRELLD